jgi:hypothetical protein
MFWISEIKRGRTDPNTIANPERDPDNGFVGIIAARLSADPPLSTRKLVQSLGIAASAGCQYVTEVLGMEHCHLRVPHMLVATQKVVPGELAQSMAQVLAKHKCCHSLFPFTFDEPRMFDVYNHRTIWVASWDDFGGIDRLSHFWQKTMLTVFQWNW